jgi:Pyridoxamine 5'-phosphate oxidase
VSIYKPRETANLAGLYEQDPIPWERALEAVGTGSLGPNVPCFLSTVRPTSRPHSAGIGVVEHHGELYFTSGPGSQKSRNLGANPACALSLRLDGIDLILEGEAQRVVDASTLEAVVTAFRAGGWPAEVDGDAFTAPFSAPSAGPPPWHLYRFIVAIAFGVALRPPHGASRWTF